MAAYKGPIEINPKQIVFAHTYSSKKETSASNNHADVLVYPSGVEPELDGVGGRNVIQLHHGYRDKEDPNYRVLRNCRLFRSSR